MSGNNIQPVSKEEYWKRLNAARDCTDTNVMRYPGSTRSAFISACVCEQFYFDRIIPGKYHTLQNMYYHVPPDPEIRGVVRKFYQCVLQMGAEGAPIHIIDVPCTSIRIPPQDKYKAQCFHKQNNYYYYTEHLVGECPWKLRAIQNLKKEEK